MFKYIQGGHNQLVEQALHFLYFLSMIDKFNFNLLLLSGSVKACSKTTNMLPEEKDAYLVPCNSPDTKRAAQVRVRACQMDNREVPEKSSFCSERSSGWNDLSSIKNFQSRLKTWKAKHAPYISMLNNMYNFDNAPPPLQTHKPLARPKPRVSLDRIFEQKQNLSFYLEHYWG